MSIHHSIFWKIAVVLIGLGAAAFGPARAADPAADQILNMIDHMASDYPKIVQNGTVKDQDEYHEQQEFAVQLAHIANTLPEGQARNGILAEISELSELINNKADVGRYAMVAGELKEKVEALQTASASPPPTDSRRGEGESPTTYAARRLEQSLDLYREGDKKAAYQTALSAYLDGFELIESSVRTADPQLRDSVEVSMARVRTLIQEGAELSKVDEAVDFAKALLVRAGKTAGEASASPLTTTISAFVILLREGVEAILVLAAIFAYLRKTNRHDAVRYVHAGWISALALGLATWFIATRLLNVSGMSREMMEGVSALVAAAMLVYVGYWLHSQVNSKKWQTFIQSQIKGSAGGTTLWTLIGVSFLAVYREVFETVLFYETLWLQTDQSGQNYLIGGIAAAAIALVGAGWAIFRYSVRLPLALFFRVNSVLLFALAVIFTGKGIAALQEAGAFPAHHVNFPTLDFLGIFPTSQGLGAQAVLLVLGIAWMLIGRSKGGGKVAIA